MSNKVTTPSVSAGKRSARPVPLQVQSSPLMPTPTRARKLSPVLELSSTSTTTLTPECYQPVQLGASTPQLKTPTLKCYSTAATVAAVSKRAGAIPRFTVDTPPDDQLKTPLDNGNKKRRNTELEELDSSIVVAVRVRPLQTGSSTHAVSDGPSCKLMQFSRSVVRVEANTVIVEDTSSGTSRSTPAKLLTFTYDHCLWSGDQKHPQYADQQKVYEVVAQPLLDLAFEGYNTCIFAYGQTGSGKSYSVMGRPDDTGIIPRFSQDLFERVQACEKRNERVCVEISYFEIYNEKIHDLLASGGDQSKKAPIKIREHNVLGPYVVGLSTFVVTCHDDLASWLSLGNKQRATAATVMNEKSSRSHSVFTIVITRVQTELIDGDMHEHSRRSKVNIVDLAGSERVDVSQTKRLRLKEGASINKSLLTLGRVIAQLSEASLMAASTPNGGVGAGRGSRKTFVPYRDSVLTWLLKESLGGNSQTTMLATVSPSSACVEETLSTLRYARQARSIVNVVHVNEDPKARLIRELRAEIEKLRGRQQVSTSPKNAEYEILQLRKKLAEKELLLRQTTTSLQEKLDQATKSKAQGAENLQKVGVALAINNDLPNLVNLNEDPQLSEALVYVLRKGSITVGRMKNGSQRDIQLKGSLIAEYHCTITNAEDAITLIPNTKGQTFVNGHRIKEPLQLHHGDRIVLGGEHYFRLNFSADESKLNRSDNLKDFAFARAELLRVQEARMTEELEMARQKTRREMLDEIENIKMQADLDLSMQRHDYEDRIKELNDALQEHDIRSEKAKWDLEAEKNLLQLEVRTEKRRSAANETSQVLDRSPLKTDFLDFIQNIKDAETSVLRPGGTEDDGPMLYELDMMIQEANCACHNLAKELKFEQFDQLMNKEFVVVVRVTDKRTQLTLDWPLETFVERLQIIRRMGEGETKLELFDASDQWTDDHFPMSLTTKDRETVQTIQQLRCNNVSMMESFDSPPLPAIRSLKSLLPASGSPSKGQLQSVDPLAICGKQCSAMLRCFSEFSNSNFQADTCKLLTNLTEMRSHVAGLQIVTSTNDLQMTRSPEWLFTLNLLLSTLLMRASKLLPTSPAGNRSKNLGSEFCEVLKNLGDSVASNLILGAATNCCKDVQNATKTLMDCILKCSNLIGQLTLSLCVTMESIDSDGTAVPLEVNGDIGLEFLKGIESVVRHVFDNAVIKMDGIEVRMNALGDDSFLHHSTKSVDVGLVGACLESIVKVKSWIELYRDVTVATSKRRTECIDDVERLVRICSQSQQMCVNLSVLVEAIMNVGDDVEIFVRGERVDFNETLLLMAEIHSGIETLFSLSEIHHFVPSAMIATTPESQLSVQQLLRSKVQAAASANRKLKKIVQNMAENQQHSSQSSAGDSPMTRMPLSSSSKRPFRDERPAKVSIVVSSSGGTTTRRRRCSPLVTPLSPEIHECPAVVPRAKNTQRRNADDASSSSSSPTSFGLQRSLEF